MSERPISPHFVEFIEHIGKQATAHHIDPKTLLPKTMTTPTMKTETHILIQAMRTIARDIQSEDGVANAAIAEAAERIADLERENAVLREINEGLRYTHRLDIAARVLAGRSANQHCSHRAEYDAAMALRYADALLDYAKANPPTN